MKRFAHSQITPAEQVTLAAAVPSARRQRGASPGEMGHGMPQPASVLDRFPRRGTFANRKGGAALIVVISLLGTLAFLGFLFYSFAAQEVASAEYFAATDTPTVPLPPDAYWDWALEQLIVGTDASLTNSALYGNKYSLLANELGTPNSDLSYGVNPSGSGPAFADVQPFDGAGITTVVTDLNTGLSPQEFGFDVNQDGVFDPTSEPNWQNFIMNFAPAADAPNGATGPYSFDGSPFSGSLFYGSYEPDAGYTYPDLNSPFLAYDALVRGWTGDPDTPNLYRVIIPSFFRPQLFPARRGTNDNSTPLRFGLNDNGFGDLYTANQTARQVLRPHRDHIASPNRVNNAGGPLVRRYISTADPQYNGTLGGVKAQSGDTNRIIYPFPFTVDLDGDGNANEMGVWTNPGQGQVGGGVNYELDADADGDGIRDAIWMDFDFPLMTLDDGRQFVPMFAVKMIDADSLLNVNAHGNAHGLFVRLQDGSIEVLDDGPTTFMGPTGLAEKNLFHQSNQGLSPSEVNLSLGLTADLRDPTHVDPKAANPPGTLDNQDAIASQFELRNNYEYDPAAVYGAAPVPAPTMPATANLEALMILHGRRQFEQLRDGQVRETRQQVLGKYADRFKIREFYRTLGSNSLADGGDIPSPLPGGWYLDDDGDSNVLGLADVFPFGSGGDDDIDAPGADSDGSGGPDVANYRREGGSFYYDQELYGVQMPPFVHPLDYLGTGSGIYDRTPAASVYLTRHLDGGSLTANPSVWPTYLDVIGPGLTPPQPALQFWQYNAIATDVGDTDRSGVLPWRLGLNTLPATPPVDELQLNNTLHDFLIDEPDEVILEPEYRNPEYDAVFPTYEMEGLHLSAGDFSKVKGSSRLRQLASVNLRRVVNSVRRTIAGRLTTDSWDRLEPGQTRYQVDAAPFDRLWEFNIWNAGNASAGDFYTAADAFPPEFGPAGSRVLAGTTNDPYRPELRLLLKNERGYSGGITGDALRYPRHKLNINRILSGEDPMAPAAGSIDRRAFDGNQDPRFRNLTPHPNIKQLLTYGAISAVTIPAMVHDNMAISAQPPTAPPFADLGLDPAASQLDRENLIVAQEWWARYDRQRLARDIFVLLYTLGLGDDSLDVAAGAYPTGYDADGNGVHDLVDQMAQFAVNYVDALDRDNVISRFEYDGNLSDGWSWTTGGPAVNGVEAQQLTLSEVVWTKTEDPGTTDYTRTAWNDASGQHQFLHMELRSTSPFETELADETWRIVRVEESGTRVARLAFKRDPSGTGLTVGAGENFTIGTVGTYNSALTNGLDVADFYVDHDGDTNWDSIVPEGTATVMDPADPLLVKPRTDLDLVSSQIKPALGGVTYTNYTEYFDIASGGTDDSGGTLVATNLVGTTTADSAADTTPNFYLVLERRRHLQAEDRLGQNDDALDTLGPDWVEVDRIYVTANDFAPGGDTTTDMQDALETIVGQYRLEPLDAPQDPALTSITSGGDLVNHTIADLWDAAGTAENPDRHLANVQNPGTDTPATAFTLWQPHFDRDFSSIYELLAVPLAGPEKLTRQLAETTGRITGIGKLDPAAPGTTPPASLAGRMFTDTDPNDDSGASPPDFTDDNRWYRLLEYLTVPNRAEESIRERLSGIVRTPGKVNLNTIRHEQVLAALVDDPFIQRFTNPGRMTDSDAGLEPPPPGGDGYRNWMDELLLARDGIDPVNFFPSSGATADRAFLPLPGVPGIIGDELDTSTGYNAANGRPQFGAQPFHPLSYLDAYRSVSISTGGNPAVSRYVDPTAHTILRHHVGLIGAGLTPEVINRNAGIDDLGLFEARPTGDVGTDAYDFHTRNRLLAKVANNSTDRSNVFLCWIVVEYFEAHQPLPTVNPNIVQVGAKLEGSPTHRGFFVIDRTRLERAVDRSSVSNSGNNNGRDDNFRFDWRDFVIHRRTIQ